MISNPSEGHFSQEEDRNIWMAICRLTGFLFCFLIKIRYQIIYNLFLASKLDSNILEIPQTFSWDDVATLLGNERHSLDYRRHWLRMQRNVRFTLPYSIVYCFDRASSYTAYHNTLLVSLSLDTMKRRGSLSKLIIEIPWLCWRN